MSSGVAQLLTVGIQDADIVGNPQVSFFKQIYKRHTNFAISLRSLSYTGRVSTGAMSTIRIPHYGDMLGAVYIKWKAANGWYVRAQGYNVVDKVQLLIGGQMIDEIDSKYISILAADLEMDRSLQAGATITGGSFTMQLPFWFCKPTNPLPLCAIKNQDVEIRIIWGNDLTYTVDGQFIINPDRAYFEASEFQAVADFEFMANYITLDRTEREYLQNVNDMHLLITQHQTNKASNTNVQTLTFSNPVKFICAEGLRYSAVYQSDDTTDSLSRVTEVQNAWWDDSTKITLYIDGKPLSDPFASQVVWSYISRYYHSKGSSLLHTGDDGSVDVGSWERIFLYPFCLETSSHQPTGALNFSRIQKAYFKAELIQPNTPRSPFYTDVYAVNYNILRIKNGSAGIMYVN